MEERKLVMNFKNALGNSFSVTVYDPRDDIQEQEIKATMDLILEKKIFFPKGYEIVDAVSARIVDSVTTNYDLVVL